MSTRLKLFFVCPEHVEIKFDISLNFLTAYGNLAAILAREHRQTEAEHAYRQALAHRPNMAETHFNL